MKLDVTGAMTDSTRAATPMRGHQRIFVVDDDDDTREALVRELSESGHDVAGFANGAELTAGLEAVERDGGRGPDLLAMDVRMPGRSGIGLLEDLRREGWKTPIVLYSSFVDADLRFRADLAGLAEVIPRPFDVDELQAAAIRARTRIEFFSPAERRWFRIPHAA
jgi:DNA-binding response OmpR family regulator